MATQTNPIPLAIENIPHSSLFLQTPPDVLYHYTTLPGALGIAESHSLWLTKIKFLSDTRELQHAFDLACQTVRTLKKQNSSGKDLSILDEFVGQLGSFENTNICVGSFCENGDLLSQWRGYGASGQGVSLGFKTAHVVKLADQNTFRLLKCVYNPADQQKIVSGFLNFFLQAHNTTPITGVTDWFRGMFLRIAPALKHSAFSEEQEWRIVTKSIDNTDSRYQVRESGNRLIPYFTLNFPADENGEFSFLEDLYLGPSDNLLPNLEGLCVYLKKQHVSVGGIRCSVIPFRQ